MYFAKTADTVDMLFRVVRWARIVHCPDPQWGRVVLGVYMPINFPMHLFPVGKRVIFILTVYQCDYAIHNIATFTLLPLSWASLR